MGCGCRKTETPEQKAAKQAAREENRRKLREARQARAEAKK